ncbi:hypothetical protein [Streptomyces sp. NPDC096311]|uniref:hypothetical protein n=1 Tax=Streptomyces sp. NPDC096311 TaxID=3366083 RepID=UPI00382EF7D3
MADLSMPACESNTAYEPLHGPDDVTPEPASLDIEIAVTRRILEETAALNIHDHTDMLKAAVALNCRVRGLLAAVAAERGEGQ